MHMILLYVREVEIKLSIPFNFAESLKLGRGYWRFFALTEIVFLRSNGGPCREK